MKNLEMLEYNKNLKQLSRQLRKNMTEAERLLWSKIRGKQLNGYQFYRQKIIENYIVDFYCPKAKLVIELDGGQHYITEGKEKDVVRDTALKKLGIQVYRFSDADIFKNMDGILDTVWEFIEKTHQISPHPSFLKRGRHISESHFSKGGKRGIWKKI